MLSKKSKERLYLIDKELEHRRAVDEPEITETLNQGDFMPGSSGGSSRKIGREKRKASHMGYNSR